MGSDSIFNSTDAMAPRFLEQSDEADGNLPFANNVVVLCRCLMLLS